MGAALGAAWVRLVNSLFASFTGISLSKATPGLGSTGPGLGAAVLAVWMSRTQTKRFSCKALAHWVRFSPGKYVTKALGTTYAYCRYLARRVREGQLISASIGLAKPRRERPICQVLFFSFSAAHKIFLPSVRMFTSPWEQSATRYEASPVAFELDVLVRAIETLPCSWI